MAFTALEVTEITKELTEVLLTSCPATRGVFKDGSATYANNLTDYKAIVDTVTDNLFNETAPTILP